jgi:hypothetical protein
LQKNADDGGIAHGLLGHACAERPHENGDRHVCRAHFFKGCLQLRELHFAEGEKNVFLAGEIVKESAFPEIRRVGDVFDRGFGEAFAGEQFHGGAEKAFATLKRLAFAAIRRESRGEIVHKMTSRQ